MLISNADLNFVVGRAQQLAPPITAPPAAVAKPIHAHLLGQWTDIIMIGGASIVAFCCYWLFVDKEASTVSLSFFAFLLTFLVNSPHFAASYQLIYGDYKKMILSKAKFFWAAIISPLLLASVIIYGIVSANNEVLGFLIQTMFLTVGWHYVKQIYGVCLVASAVQKRYFGPWERNIVLMNLYSVWGISFVSANLKTQKMVSDGIAYYSLNLPAYFMTVVYALTVVTLIATLAMVIRKYILTGVRPAYASTVGFIAIYCWYLPTISHPGFGFVIPFFHSLQYLLFVLALKKNQSAQAVADASGDVAKRKTLVVKFWGFLGLAVLLGALGFDFVPNSLDKFIPSATNPTMWYFGIVLFINVHHYFIDNVIWRGDNEFVKKFLIQANQQRAV